MDTEHLSDPVAAYDRIAPEYRALSERRNAYLRAVEQLIVSRIPAGTGSLLDVVEWSVTLDDAKTWARPWTFAMNLTRDEAQPPFEYACHEGNYGLRNILAAARAEEKAAGK